MMHMMPQGVNGISCYGAAGQEANGRLIDMQQYQLMERTVQHIRGFEWGAPICSDFQMSTAWTPCHPQTAGAYHVSNQALTWSGRCCWLYN
jgi:hypothetical protein